MVVPRRLNILLSAYACEPNRGSEPGVGWNWAQQMSKFDNVYVITRANNREVIEKYLSENPNPNLYFFYHDCGRIARKVKKFPNGVFVYYKIWQKEILPLAERIVKDKKIDIVHHVTFNEYRTPGKLYQLSVPFVWGPIGGGQFYNPIFKDAYYSRKDILKEQFRNFVNKYYLIFSHDIKEAVKKASVIMIADQSTEKIMPHTRDYIRLLETGYDLSRNGVKSYTENVTISVDRPIRLLWVGGIWPRKGLKVLIDALHSSRFENYSLDIVGDGQDRKVSEKLVKEYRLESKVRFLGALSYNEVNNLYDRADVFVFTSLRDTSGNVVLEAMSHGLPVIAINHHGVGEIVTDDTGIRIEPNSYDSVKRGFTEAIELYAKNPQLMKKHGLAGRKRLELNYSWDANAMALQDIYEKVVEGRLKNE